MTWNAPSVSSCGVIGREGLDEGDVGVGDEELRVRRVQDHHPHVVVGLDLPAEAVQLQDQLEVQEVDRRLVDGRPGDAPVHRDRQCVVVLVGHARP
jgi:hypothetical protein